MPGFNTICSVVLREALIASREPRHQTLNPGWVNAAEVWAQITASALRPAGLSHSSCVTQSHRVHIVTNTKGVLGGIFYQTCNLCLSKDFKIKKTLCPEDVRGFEG